MSHLISLIVPLRAPGERLRRFVEALDQQVLSADRWQVVYVVGADETGTHQALETAAGFRANVSLVRADGGVPIGSGWLEPGSPLQMGTG